MNQLEEYEVVFMRTGTMRVMSDGPENAMDKANEIAAKDPGAVTWDDDFLPGDARKATELDA